MFAFALQFVITTGRNGLNPLIDTITEVLNNIRYDYILQNTSM